MRLEMLAPILDYPANEKHFCMLTLCSPYEVMNLAFDAITVPAQHPTDESCFVVVVKARHYSF